MKVEHKCTLCGNLYKANKKTNSKTCRFCRGKLYSDYYQRNMRYRNKKKEIQNRINNILLSIRVNNSCGEFNISTIPNRKKLGNSLVTVTNKNLYILYLEELDKKIKKDLEFLKTNNFINK